jgi:hypothetical protein
MLLGANMKAGAPLFAFFAKGGKFGALGAHPLER